MQSARKKSKQQKIKENKPHREQKRQDDKQFINDLKTLIRLRQENQFAKQAIDRMKKKIEQNLEIQEFQEEQRDLKKYSIDLKMTKIILRQRGLQIPERGARSNSFQQFISDIGFFDQEQCQITQQQLEAPFPRRDVQTVINRLTSALQNNHQQQENQSDSEIQNKEL